MITIFNNDEHKEIMEPEAAKDEVTDEQQLPIVCDRARKDVTENF